MTRALEGLNAVVTGGNGGLGLGLAMGIAKAGGDVAVWARDLGRSAEAVRLLEAEGVRALAVRCDVTDEEQVVAAMAMTVDALGPLGCMVANAGVEGGTPLLETSLEEWRRVLRTNLDGTFLCTREAARRFVHQGTGGSMIIVSSMISRYGGARQAAYTTSKNGLIGLGRTLAVELARHRVRCNVLIPGWTRTPMNTHLQADEAFVRATTARTPVRAWAEPSEFEAVAAYLADPGLLFHTGSEVVVDGGYTVY